MYHPHQMVQAPGTRRRTLCNISSGGFGTTGQGTNHDQPSPIVETEVDDTGREPKRRRSRLYYEAEAGHLALTGFTSTLQQLGENNAYSENQPCTSGLSNSGRGQGNNFQFPEDPTPFSENYNFGNTISAQRLDSDNTSILFQGTPSNDTFTTTWNTNHQSYTLQHQPRLNPVSLEEFSWISGNNFAPLDNLSWSQVANNGSLYESTGTFPSPISSSHLLSAGSNNSNYFSQMQYDSLQAQPSISASSTQSWIDSDQDPWAHLTAYVEPSRLHSNLMSLYSPPPNGFTHIDNVLFQELYPRQIQLPEAAVPETDQTHEAETSSKNLPNIWEHSSVDANGRFDVKRIYNKTDKIKGRRSGPMKPEAVEDISQTRARGACTRCRLQKLKCTEFIPATKSGLSSCRPCSRQQESPYKGRLCYTTRFQNYAKLFSPDLVVSRFAEHSISAVLQEDSSNFINNVIVVYLSCGPTYDPIQVTATEFIPRTENASNVDYIPSAGAPGKKQFRPSYAPPWAIHDFNLLHMKAKCLKHVRDINNNPRDTEEYILGDVSPMWWNLFEVINRYKNADSEFRKDPLLEDATLLYAMQYFQSRIIKFTKKSAMDAVNKLASQNGSRRKTKVLTSKLLNLQLKRGMQSLIEDKIPEILGSLEKVLYNTKNNNAMWASSLSVMLILCACMEATQVAQDGFVVSRLRRKQTLEMSRVEYCRLLDDKPFQHMVQLFHASYKSRKSKTIFNPLKNGLKVDLGNGITPPMVDLVHDIQQIMMEYENDIKNRAKPPSFHVTSDTDLLTHHMDFRKRNSGRLVAKFLLTFLE